MILSDNAKVMGPDGLTNVSSLKKGDLVLDYLGKSNRILNIQRHSEGQLNRIKTSKGRVILCKNVNSILLSGDSCELKVGVDIYSFHHIKDVDITFDVEHYLLGWLIGDGYFGKFPAVRELYFMANPDEVDYLEDKLVEAGYEINLSFDDKGCGFYYLYGNDAEKIINKGLFYNNERSKSLDWTLFNRNQILNILRGVFDSDGSVRLKSTHNGRSKCVDITHSSKSFQSEFDIQLALSCLGIKSRISTRHRIDKRGFEFDTTDLQVYASSSRLIAQNLELFSLDRKRELLHSKSEKGNSENKKSTESLSLEFIKEIEPEFVREYSEIEVEGNCLIANGLCLTNN